MTTRPTEWIEPLHTAKIIRQATRRSRTVEDIAEASGVPARHLFAILDGRVRDVDARTHESVLYGVEALRDLDHRRLPVAPLLAQLEAREGAPLSSADRKALSRARKSGTISMAVADRVCVLMGLHLDIVWGDGA